MVDPPVQSSVTSCDPEALSGHRRTDPPDNGISLGRGPIRIVTFTTLYPSAAQPSHGIFVENRLRHLLTTGLVQARVVAPVPWFPFEARLFGRYALFARTPERELRYGIDIFHPRYPALPKIGTSLAPGLLFTATLRHLRRQQILSTFDLIDAHYFYPDGVAAILLGRILRKPVVITARGTDVNLIPLNSVPRRMICFAARNAAAIVAVSQALKDALIALGITPEGVTVLRNGVDLEMFRPGDRIAARAALDLKGKVLLSVGHLIERKGHDLTISALPKLKDCTLLIVGQGPDRQRLEALALKLEVLDRVRFLGVLPHEDLRNLYVAADALVLSSSREGWPNVLLESMACGTPVVATPIWGNPEVVSAPEAGVLTKDRSPEGLVEAVEKLFEAPPSREATRKFAERFSWNETSAGQVRLFEQVLANRSNA
jgi:teichuronic acid biosynthesis glycosyltransferase TuaC